MFVRFLPLLILWVISGCVIPGYVDHVYSFQGSVASKALGGPLPGVDVVIETSLETPIGLLRKQVEGETKPDGSFHLELHDGFCHPTWVCPPLGIGGGSGMNQVGNVSLQITKGDRVLFEGIYPVTGEFTERFRMEYTA